MWLLSITSLRTPSFPRASWLLAGASPLMTWFLLRNVSGVPPLEVSPSMVLSPLLYAGSVHRGHAQRAGDLRFGNDPKWREYKRCVMLAYSVGTSMFLGPLRTIEVGQIAAPIGPPLCTISYMCQTSLAHWRPRSSLMHTSSILMSLAL